MTDSPIQKRDPLGIAYDEAREAPSGVIHYYRNRAQGDGCGPASWSSEHDCNPVCGCHLANKCLGCGVCMNCDGCYGGEGEY